MNFCTHKLFNNIERQILFFIDYFFFFVLLIVLGLAVVYKIKSESMA